MKPAFRFVWRQLLAPSPVFFGLWLAGSLALGFYTSKKLQLVSVWHERLGGSDGEIVDVWFPSAAEFLIARKHDQQRRIIVDRFDIKSEQVQKNYYIYDISRYAGPIGLSGSPFRFVASTENSNKESSVDRVPFALSTDAKMIAWTWGRRLYLAEQASFALTGKDFPVEVGQAAAHSMFFLDEGQCLNGRCGPYIVVCFENGYFSYLDVSKDNPLFAVSLGDSPFVALHTEFSFWGRGPRMVGIDSISKSVVLAKHGEKQSAPVFIEMRIVPEAKPTAGFVSGTNEFVIGDEAGNINIGLADDSKREKHSRPLGYSWGPRIRALASAGNDRILVSGDKAGIHLVQIEAQLSKALNSAPGPIEFLATEESRAPGVVKVVSATKKSVSLWSLQDSRRHILREKWSVGLIIAVASALLAMANFTQTLFRKAEPRKGSVGPEAGSGLGYAVAKRILLPLEIVAVGFAIGIGVIWMLNDKDNPEPKTFVLLSVGSTLVNIIRRQLAR